MTRVEMSHWPREMKNGLVYPECPYAGNYDDFFKDVDCRYRRGMFCTTVQYAGRNSCPFDLKK